jgi:putative intracellular protease/amidase
MRSRRLLWSGVGVVGALGAIGGGWILSLPPAATLTSPPPIGQQEADALLASLKPPKRQRPVIAIIGLNDATEELRTKHPAIRYVADRRIVADDGVATTTGISASMPMALTLVEAIAGREKADAIGGGIGVTDWDARHDSRAFRFTRPFAATAFANSLAFWKREEFGIALSGGVDEVSLALVADAWSRTYRSLAVTFAPTLAPQESRNGVQIIPDRIATSWPATTQLPAIDRQPARALDEALREIRARYGVPTTEFVAMQLEYPRQLAWR